MSIKIKRKPASWRNLVVNVPLFGPSHDDELKSSSNHSHSSNASNNSSNNGSDGENGNSNSNSSKSDRLLSTRSVGLDNDKNNSNSIASSRNLLQRRASSNRSFLSYGSGHRYWGDSNNNNIWEDSTDETCVMDNRSSNKHIDEDGLGNGTESSSSSCNNKGRNNAAKPKKISEAAVVEIKDIYLKAGMKVKIVGGKYRGDWGTIERVNVQKNEFVVALEKKGRAQNIPARYVDLVCWNYYDDRLADVINTSTGRRVWPIPSFLFANRRSTARRRKDIMFHDDMFLGEGFSGFGATITVADGGDELQPDLGDDDEGAFVTGGLQDADTAATISSSKILSERPSLRASVQPSARLTLEDCALPEEGGPGYPNGNGGLSPMLPPTVPIISDHDDDDSDDEANGRRSLPMRCLKHLFPKPSSILPSSSFEASLVSESTTVNSNASSSTTIKVGDSVVVNAGLYNGQSGVVTKVKDRTIRMRMGRKGVRTVRKRFVQLTTRATQSQVI